MRSKFHTRQLTFRQLEIFRAVAEKRSVTEAAQALHLAQPTVSTQLAKMAQSTGAPLFEHVGKKLYLTDVGDDMLKASRALFETLDNLEMRLAQRAGLSVGRLRVSAVTTAKYLVPSWLGTFCQAHPDIEIEFQIGNRADIIRRLQDNLDDMYIFSHPPRELDIEAQTITDNPLVVIAPSTHPFANRRALTWEDIRSERFLIRENGSGTRFAIEQHFKHHDIPDMRTMTIASNEAIKESVVAGLGLAIISRHALSHMAPGNLVELDVEGMPIASCWYLVTPAGKELSPIAQVFRQQIASQLG